MKESIFNRLLGDCCILIQIAVIYFPRMPPKKGKMIVCILIHNYFTYIYRGPTYGPNAF
ncbi:hypothetical protein GGR06_002679 [Bacteroides reticulotermitis]|uniref:Uncharacterized protein n=1 Tax=Bacteroides reticulotermitis TaxID=1133319 RepID=A0A840D1F0_9BACE|nr:hypothetical protein [Bacteroides reticulotermitis]